MAKVRDMVLVWRCKTATGWQRFPVLKSKNGKVKHGYVLVNGKEEHYPEGAYYIRFYEGGLTKYEPAGSDPVDALYQLDKANRKRAAVQEAIEAGVTVTPEAKRRPIGEAIALFIADRKAQGKDETASVATQVLGSFEEACGCNYLEELQREHIYKWFTALRDIGNSERTLANKHTSLSAFWRHVGLDRDILPPKPKYEKELPTIYEGEETQKILAVADERLRLIIKVIDQSGLREREVAHLQMDSINRREGTLRVRGIPKYRFKIKTYQQRDIPITAALVEELARWHKAHPHDLLFPTPSGKPDCHILRTLKQTARRGGLTAVSVKAATFLRKSVASGLCISGGAHSSLTC